MRGGMEAVYDDVPGRLGFGQFAPMQPARGPMFSAARSRRRGRALWRREPAVALTARPASSRTTRSGLRPSDTLDLKEAKALLEELAA